MISFNLTGKTALVTGGASGIGLEAARMLAKAGAKVAINYLPADARGEAALTEFQKEGFDVIGAPGDVGDAGQAKAMVLDAVAKLGRLDLLVNNAGIPGVTVPVPSPSGTTAKVTVPAGSSSGRRLRLRGEGMPGPRGANGDLYAELRIMVPPRLSKRERELMEELAAVSSFDPRRT